MMWLKFRYRLGFETLCREVSDSISWRRFCRIGLGEPVPHPTITADRGYGEAAVERDLRDTGVGVVAIPRKGRPGAARQAIERAPRFRRLVKWRTGSEGRISP